MTTPRTPLPLSAPPRPDEELQALCDTATPPPWEVYDSNQGVWPPRPGWSVANDAFHNPPADEDAPWISVDVYVGTKADADFIAAARSAVPSLLARVVAAEKKLAAVDALCADAERIAAAMGRDITDEGYPAWVETEKLREILDDASEVTR